MLASDTRRWRLIKDELATIRKQHGDAGRTSLGSRKEVLEYSEEDYIIEEDVLMQLDVIGDTISFWAWSVDGIMPSEPLLQFDDDEVAEGGVSVVTFGSTEGMASSISCEYVQAATEHIPPDRNGLQAGDADQAALRAPASALL